MILNYEQHGQCFYCITEPLECQCLWYKYEIIVSYFGDFVTGATNIVQLPLAFVRSGYIYLRNGQVRFVGEEGGVRSRTSDSSTYAYYLGFYPTDVAPSNSNIRYYGYSLRCL